MSTPNPCRETSIKATFYASEGSPSEGRKEPFGEVRIDASSEAPCGTRRRTDT